MCSATWSPSTWTPNTEVRPCRVSCARLGAGRSQVQILSPRLARGPCLRASRGFQASIAITLGSSLGSSVVIRAANDGLAYGRLPGRARGVLLRLRASGASSSRAADVGFVFGSDLCQLPSTYAASIVRPLVVHMPW
jgi:hypothetical protein